MAAMACTPPALNIFVTPPFARQTGWRDAVYRLCPAGTEHDFLTACQLGRDAHMSRVEKAGQVPPGMYNPTFFDAYRRASIARRAWSLSLLPG